MYEAVKRVLNGFQSRNGLIWTRISVTRIDLPVSFQSRNGLIWTGLLQLIYSIPYLCFNPATVWFELRTTILRLSLTTLFQSRNGLIWTQIHLLMNTIYMRFQSRNGLIWTRRGRNRWGIFISVSIPQRSDLNELPNTSKYPVSKSFQSRNGLIWTIRLSDSIKYYYEFQSRNGLIWTMNLLQRSNWWLSFNPATVWFERYIHQ